MPTHIDTDIDTDTDTFERELSNYELIVILPPDLKDQDLKQKLDDLRAAITEEGGKILQEDIAGLKNMAYRIRRHERGFYAVFHFEHDGRKIPELEKTVRIEMGVLRHLLMKTPRHYFFKTLGEYQKEAEAAALKEEQEKKAAEAEQGAAKFFRGKKKMEKSEKPESSQELPVEAAKEPSKEPAKAMSEEELKEKLKQEEKKLESLLENPDIQI